MQTYRVRIDRLGRKRSAQSDQYFDAKGTNDLASQLHRYARGHLISRDFIVDIFDDGTWAIIAGFHLVGKGTWEIVTKEATAQ